LESCNGTETKKKSWCNCETPPNPTKEGRRPNLHTTTYIRVTREVNMRKRAKLVVKSKANDETNPGQLH
jgi:hypothetical protein